MKSISQEIEALYRQLYEHTHRECKNHCAMTKCCDSAFCERAREYAAAHGVELQPTGHPTLLYMGQNGCVVPPHYRPECTEFVCSIRDGRPSGSGPEWTKRYREIRQRIYWQQVKERNQ